MTTDPLRGTDCRHDAFPNAYVLILRCYAYAPSLGRRRLMKPLLHRFRTWLNRPRRCRAYRRMKHGHGHALKGDWFNALVEYKAALEEDPTYAPAFVNRGLAWLNVGDFDMAEVDLNEALVLEPENAFTHYARALVLRQREKHREAIEDLDESFRIDPAPTQYSLSDLLGERGACWSALLEHRKAIDDLTEALNQKPDVAVDHQLRGWNRHCLGDLRGAEADYSEAIRIAPAEKRLYLSRAGCRGLLGDEVGAVEDLEMAGDAVPEATRMVLEARRLSKAGEHRQAVTQYEAVLKAHPSDPNSLNNLAWVLATCSDDSIRNGERAVLLAEDACEQTGFSFGSYVETLAAAYAEAGRFDDAVRTQEKAESLYSEDDLRDWGFLKKLYESRKAFRQPQGGD